MQLKERKLPFDQIERQFRNSEISDEELAELCGVSRKTLRRWRQCGLGFFRADEVSCRLGFHPTYFWGDDYFGPIYEGAPKEEID